MPVAMAAVRRRNHTRLIDSWLSFRDPSPRLQIPAHINEIVAWYGRNSSTMTYRILSSLSCALRLGQLFLFRPQPPELQAAGYLTRETPGGKPISHHHPRCSDQNRNKPVDLVHAARLVCVPKKTGQLQGNRQRQHRSPNPPLCSPSSRVRKTPEIEWILTLDTHIHDFTSSFSFRWTVSLLLCCAVDPLFSPRGGGGEMAAC